MKVLCVLDPFSLNPMLLFSFVLHHRFFLWFVSFIASVWFHCLHVKQNNKTKNSPLPFSNGHSVNYEGGFMTYQVHCHDTLSSHYGCHFAKKRYHMVIFPHQPTQVNLLLFRGLVPLRITVAEPEWSKVSAFAFYTSRVTLVYKRQRHRKTFNICVIKKCSTNRKYLTTLAI